MNVYFKNGSTFTSIYDLIYPVGCIWVGTIANGHEPVPANAFGGSWSRMREYFILSRSDNIAIDSTGGSWSMSISVDNMPSHNHAMPIHRNGKDAGATGSGNTAALEGGLLGKGYNGEVGFNGNVMIYEWSNYDTDQYTYSAGNGKAFSITNPYIYENIWYRAA